MQTPSAIFLGLKATNPITTITFLFLEKMALTGVIVHCTVHCTTLSVFYQPR